MRYTIDYRQIPVLSILMLICLPLQVLCQSPANSKVYCNTDLPATMLQLPSDRYSASVINTYEFKREKRLAMEAHKGEISYALYYAFSSGEVLPGGLFHEYVNLVLDSVLFDDPDLRARMSVFVTNDSYVNAYASADGILFITMGLLARLHNEAELAFILAHEIAHFEKQHVAQSISFEYDLETDPKKYSTIGHNALGMEKHQYSRSLEMDADAFGLERFLRSRYSIRSLDSLFLLLEMSEYAFLPIQFSYNMLGFDTLWIQDDGKCLNPPSLAKRLKEHDDTTSTHPSTIKRYQKFRLATLGLTETDRAAFLVSQKQFIEIRDIARRITARDLLIERNYNEALLFGLALLESDPGLDTKLLITKALYGMNFFKNFSSNEIFDAGEGSSFDELELFGSVYQCDCYFSQLSSLDIAVLSLSYAWQTHQAYPESKEAESLLDFNLRVLINQHGFQPGYYMNFQPAYYSLSAEVPLWEQDALTIEEIFIADSTRHKSLRLASGYAANQLVKLVLIDSFREHVNKLDPAFIKVERGSPIILDRNFELSVNTKCRTGLGIDSIIVVNPKVVFISMKNGAAFDVHRTERAEKGLFDAIDMACKAHGVNAEILDLMLCTPTDTQAFKDMATLSRWFYEYPIENTKHSNYFIVDREAIDDVVRRYGTSYALFSTMIFSRLPSRLSSNMLYIPILNPITWPYYIYEWALVRPAIVDIHILINIETGEIVFIDAKYSRTAFQNKGLIRSHINEVIWQIHKTPKNEK